MKTVKEFLNQEEYYSVENSENVRQAMVNFARQHVQLAITEISKERNHPDAFYEEKTWWIPQDSILNSYNLDNIK